MQVLIHQEQQWHTQPDGKGVEDKALIIGIMSDWMAQKLAQLGHGAAVMLDTTFGTNKYMVSKQTALRAAC